MATDLRIVVPNRPGTLLAALQAVADAGIGLEGFCGDLRPGETWGYIHLLISDPEPARRAIEEAGFEVSSQHEVDIVQLERHPGGLAEAVARYTDQGDNLEVAYTTADGKLVVGTESMRSPVPGIKTKDARY